MQNELPQEQILLSWNAPLRVSEPKSREHQVTLIAITSVVALVLFLAEGLMPVILIGALFFLYWNLQKMPSGETLYQLTNLGVKLAGIFYPWESFTHYWADKRGGRDLLVLGHKDNGTRVNLYLSDDKTAEVEAKLAEKLKAEKLPPTTIERIMGFVTTRLPS